MSGSRFISRRAPLVALGVLAIVVGYQRRASVIPWFARNGIALVGAVAFLGALIGSWVRVYRGRTEWARVWAPRELQPHRRFLEVWWSAVAAAITLVVLWFVWPFALLARLIFAILAAPFALLLFDMVRFRQIGVAPPPAGSWRALAMLGALGLICCVYLIVVGPGRYPHVSTLAYLGALAAGSTAATRVGHEAAEREAAE